MSAILEGRRIELRGVVQGVGFRPFVWRLAREVGIAGRVCNDASGVVVEAFGAGELLDLFLRRLRTEAPAAARIVELDLASIPPEEAIGFEIVGSAASGERRVSIPADLATCADCERELLDSDDRRHGYPFTNCTACGPRFTIATGVPYDRPATTMAPFPMCPRCRAEYDDPADRRFHAQPNACPVCGPRLELRRPDGAAVSGDPIDVAAAELLAGRIVAVKGLGGFHLAVDATSSEAVAQLRERKHRDEKPLAVMVEDLAAAEALAEMSPAESALVASVERPIVLLRRKAGASLAAEVAPGSPLVGLMLPYTPLHRLLLRAVGRPLVMTSGNLSDEPMATRNDEALERLGRVADLFLLHDREIASRCDDSVARVVSGAPLVLRRSRGFVPRAIRLRRPVEQPILAVGGHLKNAVCLAAGDLATFGPHVGDLETAEAVAAFEETVDRLERFLGVRPELVAHDLHPDYASTRYALRRPEPKVAVQHHHAHVASALAEQGIAGPVYGVAFDGTGFGTDGSAWGGEILLVQEDRFERLATLRPIRLAGGEAAIREPWRLALAMLDDTFDGEPPLDRIPLFAKLPEESVRTVRRMIDRGLNSPLAHGAGRWFDAFAALVLGQATSSYEGQAAMLWNFAANPAICERYGFELRTDVEPWEIDLRPAVRRAVSDLVDGVRVGTISARFHGVLGGAVAVALRRLAENRGALPVVLTGGCFQNERLVGETLAALGPECEVLLHREVPAGDGGIALGQVIVADARLRSRAGEKGAL